MCPRAYRINSYVLVHTLFLCMCLSLLYTFIVSFPYKCVCIIRIGPTVDSSCFTKLKVIIKSPKERKDAKKNYEGFFLFNLLRIKLV